MNIYMINDFDPYTHIFTPTSNNKAPNIIPIEDKIKMKVFEHGNYIFYPLPLDEEFIRREGWDMQHCLAFCQKDYCNRMRDKKIEVYSMTDKTTNMPVVDIEVALVDSSYGGPVDGPTVTQIRGMRNQCPPKDDYIPSLMEFFKNYGEGWKLGGHGVKNFDYQMDGELLLERWNQIQIGS